MQILTGTKTTLIMAATVISSTITTPRLTETETAQTLMETETTLTPAETVPALILTEANWLGKDRRHTQNTAPEGTETERNEQSGTMTGHKLEQTDPQSHKRTQTGTPVEPKN